MSTKIMGIEMAPEALVSLSKDLRDMAVADPRKFRVILDTVNGAYPLARCLTSEELLSELLSRGGHPGALAEAALLCIKKSQDYNQGMGCNDPHKVNRSAYFPFGAISYAQMLHTKSMRFNSLVQKIVDGGAPNFEGLVDTALDMINYAGFYVADQRLLASTEKKK